jgi:hypothetical protein
MDASPGGGDRWRVLSWLYCDASALRQLTMRSADSTIYPGVARKAPDPTADPGILDGRFKGLGLTPAMIGGSDPVKPHADRDTDHFFFNCSADTPELSRAGITPYERKVAVFIPAAAAASPGCPFIVVNDGMGYVEAMVPILDSLIDQGRVPANLVALFVDSGGDDAQGSQRGLEYDTVSGAFAEFLQAEVVPFVSAKCAITLTSDPEGRATMGGSSGGSCAFSCAWFRPDLFRRVLTYSGTFVNQQSPYNPDTPTGCWEYHSESGLVLNSSRKPLRGEPLFSQAVPVHGRVRQRARSSVVVCSFWAWHVLV